MIPIDRCVKGGIYRISSRNLRFGVYDGKGGFIGVREKFGDRYLFTEFHYDQGAPHGTVTPLKRTGRIPEGMEVLDHIEVIKRECSCGHPSARHERKCKHKNQSGVGEHDCYIGCLDCECTFFDGHRYMTSYPPLFKLLMKIERKAPREKFL
jgi:hypothetical protein